MHIHSTNPPPRGTFEHSIIYLLSLSPYYLCIFFFFSFGLIGVDWVFGDI